LRKRDRYFAACTASACSSGWDAWIADTTHGNAHDETGKANDALAALERKVTP
jgi:hypothetical protein